MVLIIRVFLLKLKPEYYVYLLGFFVILGTYQYWEKAQLLFLFFLFFSLMTIRRGGVLALLNCSLIGILSFFIKLNTGIVVNILFFLLVGFLVVKKYRPSPWFFIGISLVHAIVIFFLARVLLVELLPYFNGSLHIIKGYNDAMQKLPDFFLLTLAGLSLLVFANVILRNFRNWFYNWENLFILFFVLGGTFVFFKNGFVRADGHTRMFFTYFPGIFGCFYLFTENKEIKASLGKAFVSLLIISGLGILYLFSPFKVYRHLKEVPYKAEIVRSRNFQAAQERNFQINKKKREIPGEILSEIDTHAVDIMPWEISFLYFSQLNYDPRPVIQSYSAYNSYLDKLNANSFLSEDKPEYVLFHHYHTSIDYRYGFWDEAQTKMALLKCYEPVMLAGKFLLLKKRESPLTEVELGTEERTIAWNEELLVKESDNLQFLYAEVEYNLLGKIRRFLFQPNEVKVHIDFEKYKSSKPYRAVVPILEGGVLLNKELISPEDYFNFFAFQGKANAGIKKIRFETSDFWMKKQIKLKIREFKMVDTTKNSAPGIFPRLDSLFFPFMLSPDTLVLTDPLSRDSAFRLNAKKEIRFMPGFSAGEGTEMTASVKVVDSPSFGWRVNRDPEIATLSVELFLEKQQTISLGLHDDQGNFQKWICREKDFRPGVHSVSVFGSDNSPGVYYLILDAQGIKRLKKIVL
jgi:hypothetical protein